MRYLIVSSIYFLLCCKDTSGNNEGLNQLLSRSYDVVLKEVMMQRCPPPPLENDTKIFCPEGFVTFCDTVFLNNTVFLKKGAEEFYAINAYDLDTYMIPILINDLEQESSVIYLRPGNCVLKFMYPQIHENQAKIKGLYRTVDNYFGYEISFQRNNVNAPWRLVHIKNTDTY